MRGGEKTKKKEQDTEKETEKEKENQACTNENNKLVQKVIEDAKENPDKDNEARSDKDEDQAADAKHKQDKDTERIDVIKDHDGGKEEKAGNKVKGRMALMT